jgi:2-polyprenyl-3-methyl-5-hydroxy-6-metoxy-1,4-benzoquinol methylase
MVSAIAGKDYYENYWQNNTLAGDTHVIWKKQILYQELKLVKNKDILDWGCGDGAASSWLAKQNNVHGYDISDEAEARFQEAGIRKMSEFAGQFDILLLLDVLEHILDIDSDLGKLTDRVKNSGLAYISVPNGGNLYNRLMFLLGNPIDLTDRTHTFDRDGWSEHIHTFTKDRLERMCKKHGYTIEKRINYFPDKINGKWGLMGNLAFIAIRCMKLYEFMPSIFALGFLYICRKV